MKKLLEKINNFYNGTNGFQYLMATILGILAFILVIGLLLTIISASTTTFIIFDVVLMLIIVPIAGVCIYKLYKRGLL